MPPRYFFFMVASVLLAACEKAAPPAIKPAPPVSVQVVQPERGDIERWLTRPAQVRPQQQAVLMAKISGYLKTVSVDEGDAVKAGDVLAEIEVPELVAEGAQCQAELDAARIEHERQVEAVRKSPDLVMPQRLDTAKARFEMAQASLLAHETKAGFTRITAPFSGIITKRWADPGAFIPAATASSRPETSALLTLMDFNTVRIEVAIPEREVPFVKTGNVVTLGGESLTGQKLSGKITRFAHALDDATRTMNAQIEMPNPGLDLRPGMFIDARIALEKHSGVLLVPVEALITEKLKTSVFLAAEGKAGKTVVKAGFHDGTRVEIIEGVKPEDKVILAGRLSLSDGQAISIADAQ